MSEQGCIMSSVDNCEYGSVIKCPDCSTFRLNIGPLSLKLHEEVLMELAAMMGRIHHTQTLKDAQPDLHLVTPDIATQNPQR